MQENPSESGVQNKIHLKTKEPSSSDTTKLVASEEHPGAQTPAILDGGNKSADGVSPATNSFASNSSASTNSLTHKDVDKKRNRRELRDLLVDPLAIVASVVGLCGILYFCGTSSHPAHEALTKLVPPAMQASKTETPDFHPYIVKLQKQIKSNWHPPEGSATNLVMMHFKISKTGEVSDVGFDRLSHISEADAAALKAVVETMPSVGALPPGSPDSVDISFTFEYNVDKSKSTTK